MESTGKLLVEHTISGILASVWILSVIFCLNGVDLEVFKSINDYWGVVAVVGTAISYPLGMFVDTVADWLLDNWKVKFQKNMSGNSSLSIIGLIRKAKDNSVTNYFAYNRFKERICRSSMLNFILIALSSSCFIICRGNEVGLTESKKIALSVLVSFLILSLVAFWVWSQVVKTVDEKVLKISAELKN